MRALRADGVPVHAVSRSGRDSDDPGLLWWKVDLADAAAVRAMVGEIRPGRIFHLASLVSGRRDLDLVLPAFQDNLASTVHLLAAAAETGDCRRIVLAGSMEEPDLANGEAPSSPYAVAKGAATLYARFFHALYRLPVVQARIFMVYGPGQIDRRKVVPYSILRALAGESPELSSGVRPVDWIYVEDVVEGLLALSEAPGVEGEVLDLGSGELVTVRDLVERVCRLLDAPAPRLGAVPDRPLEATRRADVARTEARIGWRAMTDLATGLARTIDSLRPEPPGPAA